MMTRRMGAPCCGGFYGSPQTIFDPEHKQVVQGILEEVQDPQKQKKLLAARVVHMHLVQLSLPQVLQRMGCGESVGRVLPSSSSLPVAVSP